MSEEKKRKTFSYDVEYIGYSHPIIKDVNKTIRDHRSVIREIEKKIVKLEETKTIIRESCIHTFLFSSNGPYETYFQCSICGGEIEV